MYSEWKVLNGDEVQTYFITKHEVERITERAEKRDAPSKKLPWLLRFLLKYYKVTVPCEQITQKSEV